MYTNYLPFLQCSNIIHKHQKFRAFFFHQFENLLVFLRASMAFSFQGLAPTFSGLRSYSSSSVTTSLVSLTIFPENGWKISNGKKITRKMRNSRVIKAMVQQVVQGASATYAKEMERLSAKESLLLAVSSISYCII